MTQETVLSELAEASKTLSRYEVPVDLHIVDALPRTPSGKAELHATRELQEHGWT